MQTLSIRAALGEGWKQFNKRPGYLFSLALAVWVLFAAGSVNAAFTALGYIIYGGYLAVLINHYRGTHITFDDLFTLDSRWISFAFVSIIKFFFIGLGLLIFIVPGIYLATKWSFAELLIIDKGMRPMEALRTSSAMTVGHRWTIFFFGVVSLFIALLGLVVFVVGIVPASLVITFAMITFYSTLMPAAQGTDR